MRLEVSLYQDDRWSFGPAASATFPTGSQSKQLGMGHVMASPSVWVLRQVPGFFFGAELGYSRALGSEARGNHALRVDARAHHVGSSASSPLPSPMNFEELWTGASAAFEPDPRVTLNVGALGAVPVSGEPGSARATLKAGAEFPFGAASTGLGVEVDILGSTRRQVVSFSVAVGF